MTTQNSPALGRSLARFVVDPLPPVPKVLCSSCTKATKCCDYQPFIPNFTLGALIEKGFIFLPEISEHFYTPLGLIPAQSFRQRRERGELVACQFFAEGQCQIWEYRPGECSQYFCEGRTKSHESWSERLFQMETRLAQAALIEQGFSRDLAHAQIDALNEGRGEGEWIWPDLEALYQRSWRWASQVDVEAVREWL